MPPTAPAASASIDSVIGLHAESTSSQIPAGGSQAHTNTGANGRRGDDDGARRGARNRGRVRPVKETVLSMRPPSIAPAVMDNATQSASSSPVRARGKRSGPRSQPTSAAYSRRFGGHLTSGVEKDSSSSALAADAAPFVPGQSPVRRLDKDPTRRQQRRLSKSSAPDIATRTHEDIDNRHYECPICTNDVLRNSKVWSCHTCWTVFHLSCIKKWSTNQGSAAAQQQPSDGSLPPPRQWRCPGCNLPKDTLPKSYSCWCDKEMEPRAPIGVPPHSCGNTCGKQRLKDCPHPCDLTCHAGPCPHCSHMGPTQPCFCGKHEKTRRCVDTDYEHGWSCAEPCGDLMPCGEHFCSQPCHEGLCGACPEVVHARCYCGKIEEHVPCGDRKDELTSHRNVSVDGNHATEEWTGSFTCDDACNRLFDCGIHRCRKNCHQQDAEPAHCPRSVDVISTCPCGKTQVLDLLDSVRSSCTDPVPNCTQQCLQSLNCGHACTKVCHSGPCPPCTKMTEISCRCGKTTCNTMCHQGDEQAPQCRRICRATLGCGRHVCDERCCTGERKAADRLSVKKKQRPIDAAPIRIANGIEPEHICTRICGRPLKCGNHECQDLCHKGPCSLCPEAIFHDIACACGRTVLQPPLACGTRQPPCRFPCNRSKSCGHAQVVHNCHPDDESCPKCPFLVDRRCMCGKNVVKHQQCWLQDARCGEICGKQLKCGSHFCRKQCHRPGECEDAGRACQQACGKPKQACDHPDENICHAPYGCKEDKPCPMKTIITCACQAQKQEVKCAASKSTEGNATKSLPCNEECARLERNRRLAVALNIDPSTHADGGDHIPYSDETLSMFQQHPKWCQTQEREFRVFATSNDERRLNFKPMPASQRAFIHVLAEDFGLDAESMDPEPHRHVAIFKTPRFVSAPSKTVGDCVRIRMRQRATATATQDANPGSDESSRTKADPEPFDSFVVTSPRFGLTVEEVRAALTTALQTSTSMLSFEVAFLPADEVLIKPIESSSSLELDATLRALKPSVVSTFIKLGIGNVELCRTDPASGLTVRCRESEFPASTNGDGWSRVAAKGAASRRTVTSQSAAPGSGNTFWALGGNKVTFTRGARDTVATAKPVKKVKVDVVDDWEAAATADELAEHVAVEREDGVEPVGTDTGKGVDDKVAESDVGKGRLVEGHDVLVLAESA